MALACAGPSFPAQAQTQKPAQAATPVKFVPGKINTTPVGVPIDSLPRDTETSLAPGGKKVGEELTERRTATTKTMVGEHGVLETQFFSEPINFKDAKGVWQEIDNNLVASSAPGKTLRNAANEIAVSLPESVGQGSASVESKGHSIEMKLVSAQAAGGESELASAAAPAPKVEGSKATYSGVLPNLDVAYTAKSAGLKEDLILHAHPKRRPASIFAITLSPGLTALELPSGSIGSERPIRQAMGSAGAALRP